MVETGLNRVLVADPDRAEQGKTRLGPGPFPFLDGMGRIRGPGLRKLVPGRGRVGVAIGTKSLVPSPSSRWDGKSFLSIGIKH